MRSRRNSNRHLIARGAAAVGSLAGRAWTGAMRRPVDAFAVLGATAASLVIIVNAVFLQSGVHPAPFFANPTPRPAMDEIRLRAAEMFAPAAVTNTATPASVRPAAAPVAPARRYDPIGELIGASARLMAVQRALSDYGYGQIKPSGILDEPTSAAIAKFERDQKLPVTGRMSDRLVSDLSAMVGHPIE